MGTITPEQVQNQQAKGKVTVEFRAHSVGLAGMSEETLEFR
jgi:hypothetical protein